MTSDRDFWDDYDLQPTADDLERWRLLSARATRGPWLAFDASAHPSTVGDNWDIVIGGEWHVTTDHVHASEIQGEWDDYPFIAAARTALPVLLSLVRAYQKRYGDLSDEESAP